MLFSGDYELKKMAKRFVFSVIILTATFIFAAPIQASRDIFRANLGTEKNGEPSAKVLHILEEENYLVMSNGIVSITIKVPIGMITEITYRGGENLLDNELGEEERGRWNVVWTKPGSEKARIFDAVPGMSYEILMYNENQIEVSFTTEWSYGSNKVPLKVDKRFVMLRESSGFYTYVVLEKSKNWPAFTLQIARLEFKLNKNKFQYMAISDERQRFMPTAEDRITGRRLDYPEAVLLTNSTNPDFKGEVDDKYFYSMDNKDNKVHGWASSNSEIGFWMITPSNEFKTGGPFKQDLTSHVGPTVLSVFISPHYAGKELALEFDADEQWKKVLGPVFVYLNSDFNGSADHSLLWNDAKSMMEAEEEKWPYSFPLSNDFVKSESRGAISGRLLIHDWTVHDQPVPAASAYIGLAETGAETTWQNESKKYQFWTQTESTGSFLLENVVPGNYRLFSFIAGILGDLKHSLDVIISPGSNISLGDVTFEAPREGFTLWEIGVPDRSAAEFFIPDPDPKYKIHQYASKGKSSNLRFRQYGLWARYAALYPEQDLVFRIGKDDYKKDWFFAHVTRDMGNGTFQGTTWRIVFDIHNVKSDSNYTLQVAIASANGAILQVGVNSNDLLFSSAIGRDNAVARHGIHGLYHFYSIGIQGNLLLHGENTIFLTQADAHGPFNELMYDYIRLESPRL